MSHTQRTRDVAYAKLVFRRRIWFEQNGPCRHCGATEKLELDHIDPEQKEHHALWSWTEKRRAAELAKCQALCHDCHQKKTAGENQERMLGVDRLAQRKITPEHVEQMRLLRGEGKSYRAIGRIIGLDHKGVIDYINFGRQRSTINKSGKQGPRQYVTPAISAPGGQHVS